jgi:preprotein translocase subunit YajC
MEPQFFQYLAQEKAIEQPSIPSNANSQPSLFTAYYPLIMLLLVFAFLYFFSIRPQRKEEKRRKEMLASLKKGDMVVTQAGIIGSVHSIKDDVVVLNLQNNARMEVLKSTIYDIRNKNQKQEEK